jgi:hypothetical protein
MPAGPAALDARVHIVCVVKQALTFSRFALKIGATMRHCEGHAPVESLRLAGLL